MRRAKILAVAMLLLPGLAAWASGPQTAPFATTLPATSAVEAPAEDPEVVAILNDLQAADEKYKTIKANIAYRVEQAQTGDEERRTGWVAYQRGLGDAPGKFRISFEKLKQGDGPWTIDKVDYAMDGQWLHIARHSIRQLTRHQVAAEGQKVEPLKLGKGPFPVPFGQRADDVLEYFEATTRPLADGEPKGSVHLRLQTRRQHRDEMSFVWAEMWIDSQTHLPVKLVSEDKSRNKTTVTFEKVETGLKLDDKMFSLPRPAGWQLVVQPLERSQ